MLLDFHWRGFAKCTITFLPVEFYTDSQEWYRLDPGHEAQVCKRCNLKPAAGLQVRIRHGRQIRIRDPLRHHL